jgi:TRAP-type C4-dicarboxylate transport system permease large subunit
MEAAMMSAAILFIVVATSTLTWVMDYAQLPQSMVAAIQSWNLPPLTLLLLIGVFYVVLGMFIDPISMMLMTLSVTYPIVQLAGYDAIWFGVALMILIEVGLITPPVGMILFVLRGLFPAVALKDIVLGAFPFVLVILSNVVLIAMFPQIVTWLPSLMVK